MANVDPGVTDANSVRAEENEIALPEIAPLPDPPVTRVMSEVELNGSRVWKSGAVVAEGPEREAGAIESLRRGSAPAVRDAQLTLGSVLDVLAFLEPILERMSRSHIAQGQKQCPQKSEGEVLHQPKT
jgi:hypothetical protein